MEHVIERAVTLSNSPMIMSEELPPKINQMKEQNIDHSAELLQPGLTLDELSKQYLVKTLHANKWNLTKTAEVLGISVRTVQRMVDRFQLKAKSDIDSSTPS